MPPRLRSRASRHTALISSLSLLLALLPVAPAAAKEGWWNSQWNLRKPVMIDTGSEGVDLGGPVANGVALVRLHAGNFDFLSALEDGSDIRFLAADGETVLAHQVESFDPLMNEAFVWVRIPEIPAGEQTQLWLYYGNPEGGADVPVESTQTFDEKTLLAYHFAERGQPARDASPAGNHSANAGTPAEGSLIGTGTRFLGRTPITVAPTPSLSFPANAELSLRAWLRPQSLGEDAVWFSRVDGENALRLGLANGIPYVEVVNAGAAVRSTPIGDAQPLAPARWTQIAMVAKPGNIDLFVDGKPYASLAAGLPSLNSTLSIGAESPDSAAERTGYIGEMDEFVLSGTSLPIPAISFHAINQSGSEESMRLLVAGEDEGGTGGGHNETLEHVMLFGDIARNMMFDGWIAVGICIIMIMVGWSVGIAKAFYLGKLQKGNDIFFKLWKAVTADRSLLDESEQDQMEPMAQSLPKRQRLQLRDSPLYHIYHRGLEEIEIRLGRKAKVKMNGLSARSMQAIRASMDASLVHENHRLNNGLVFLTIGIAGGPYVGLLGTVVGVMITFALIAKTGEVEVNSIAPGIASALLATVFGLLVAIPALFIYSYLSGRIKNTISSMEVFIDDFVAKIAEFYPPPSEQNFVPVPEVHVHRQEPPAPPALSDGARAEVPEEPTARIHKH